MQSATVCIVSFHCRWICCLQYKYIRVEYKREWIYILLSNRGAKLLSAPYLPETAEKV